MKSILTTLLISIFIFLSGCARTVNTQQDILTLDFAITFNQAPDFSNTIYVIVFSSTNAIKPDNLILNEYFFFPGKVFNSNQLASLSRDVNFYYESYFDTWSKFIFITGSSVDLIESGSLFDSNTTDNFSYIESQNFEYNMSVTNDTLNFECDITKLGYEENDSVNVVLLTFDKSTFIESGLIQDKSDSIETFNLTKFNEKSIINLENTFITPQSDIIKWDYSVY